MSRTVALASVALALTLDAGARTSGEPRGDTLVDTVVLHATGGPDCRNGKVVWVPGATLEASARYLAQHPVLGIHYLIGRDGKVVAQVPEGQVAQHTRGFNRRSIGIELVNNGDGRDPYPAVQLDALRELLRGILVRHRLGAEALRGHAELDRRGLACAPDVPRRQDPGDNFPLERLREALKRAHKPSSVQ